MAGESVTLVDNGDFALESELGRFDDWMGELLEGVEKETQPQVILGYGLEFTGQVMGETPVDKGRARAGWSVLYEEEGISWEKKGSDSDAIEQGVEESEMEDGLSEDPPYLELVNGVPYIVPLEHGHSDQAPAGMTRITLRRMQAGSGVTEAEMRALEAAIRRADRAAGW